MTNSELVETRHSKQGYVHQLSVVRIQFLIWAHGFRSLSPQLFVSVVWACGGLVPCGESTWQKWILHLMVYEKPREQDEEVVVQIPHLQTAPSTISVPFQGLISGRLCSLPQAPCADDQALHIYLPNHHREKVFVWSLIYSLKCNHPGYLDCKEFPGMSELDFSRDFLALNVTLSSISHIFSIFLVVSQTSPG